MYYRIIRQNSQTKGTKRKYTCFICEVTEGIYTKYAGFEVLTAVVMKSTIFRDITPWSPSKVNRRFKGTCRLHLQGRRISQARNHRESRQQAWFLLSGWFLARFILRTWRWRKYFLPKHHLTFSGLLLYWRYNPVWALVSTICFVTVYISGVGSLAPCPAPNIEDQGLHFIWPYSLTCLACVVLSRAYAPANIALRVIEARKPLRDKAIVFEEAFSWLTA
jgi:hypothetical protein